jgi:hypothetical protein
MKLLRMTIVFIAITFPHHIQAQWLTYPNGEFPGPRTASVTVGNTTWTVTISNATDSIAWPVGVSLYEVLSTQGINSQNGWTINGFSPGGQAALTDWRAFAGNATSGAQIRIDYSPGTQNLRWIQIVRTNAPYGPLWQPRLAYHDGWFYIDNGLYASGGDPFYDPAGDATQHYFHDMPYRDHVNYGSLYWIAYLYPALGDAQTKTLSIADVGIQYAWYRGGGQTSGDPGIGQDSMAITAVPEVRSLYFLMVFLFLAVVSRLVQRTRLRRRT